MKEVTYIAEFSFYDSSDPIIIYLNSKEFEEMTYYIENNSNSDELKIFKDTKNYIWYLIRPKDIRIIKYNSH